MTKISHKQRKLYLILFIIFAFFNSKIIAQDVIYFDEKWRKTTKDSACFYRLKPLKFNAKEVLGYKLKYIDSIFQIKDYYIKNDSLQFQGYAIDEDARHLIGEATRYAPSGKLIVAENYDYNPKNSPSKFIHNCYKYSTYMALNLGYHSLAKGINSGYFGFDIRASNTTLPAFNMGLGTYLTKIDNEFLILPAIQVNYAASEVWLMELSSSNRFFKPTVGFNMLNAVQLKMGYNFWYSDKQYNGFTFGVNFCLGGRNFYDYLKLL
jgi:hypothetical protein